MKALSLDLRQRILTALQAGHKRADVAVRFAVSESSVYRLQRQFKTTHDLAPKKRPGRGHALPEAHLPALEALVKEQIQEQHDPTAESLVAAWQERTGNRLGLSTMHRALQRLARSFKKSAASPRKGTKPSATPSETR